jgi:hypothetical protein
VCHLAYGVHSCRGAASSGKLCTDYSDDEPYLLGVVAVEPDHAVYNHCTLKVTFSLYSDLTSYSPTAATMLQYLGHLSTPQLLAAALGLLIAYKVTTTVIYDAKLRKLGARAPIVPSYLPFSLDIIYNSVVHTISDKNYELWVGMFTRAKCPPGSWTARATIAGQPIVFTADPENMKAILATQFKQYGKGQEFENNWNDFLGHGIFAVDGELWQNARQLIRPQFIKDRISDLEIFEEHVQILIKKLEKEPEVDSKCLPSCFPRYIRDGSY